MAKAPDPSQFLNAAAIPTSDQSLCPQCHAGRLRRSRMRTLLDRVKMWFTTDRPFRCDHCGWRGWLPPMHTHDRAVVNAPPAPDLTSLDSAIKLPDASLRPSFSPRNIQ